MQNTPKNTNAPTQADRDAARHGLFSHLATIKGESPQEYAQVSADLYRTWHPADEFERCLVDTMATCMWRRMRMLALESVTIDIQLTTYGCTDTADLAQTTNAYSALSQKDGSFELIHRYESRYLRAFERAGRTLMAYRKSRRQESRTPESLPATLAAPTPQCTPTPESESENQKRGNEPKPRATGREARRLKRWQKRHAALQMEFPCPPSTPNPALPGTPTSVQPPRPTVPTAE